MSARAGPGSPRLTIRNLDALLATLRRAGVTFDAGRAFMIEDPDGLAIELIEAPE
ncbi:MAG: hypothetical protein HY560_12775 [Gemmatimonadetes bacterium]|nr:hypothetical protein [Gemmatimonadota bacterium]